MNRMSVLSFRSLAAGVLALALSACGGGGGADGGIGGTGGGGGGGTAADVSIGTITAFGSVWVNGVEFNSNNATFKRDDDTVTQNDLRVGMVARVDGSISGASATAITARSAVKGYVESVSATQLVVMGQTVIRDGSTRFENGVPVAGNYVEVHGLVVSDGTVAATYIERKATQSVPPFVVKGIVRNHSSAAGTFTVGGLNVTLGSGAITNDMPGGSWNGLQVEVKGSTCAGNPPATNMCGTLTASKVEPEGPRGNIARVEVEAFVTSFTSSSSFSVGTQPVVTNAGTSFVGGLAGEIVLGTKLEVEGSLSNGILTATKVSFRENIRFEANIASLGANSLTLAGLDGITVEINSLTQFRNATFNQLLRGNNLRVRGRPGSGNSVIATEVEFRSASPDSRVILQGVASAVSAPRVTLLGIAVDTTPIADNNFKDINDAVIGRTAFFAAAAPGKLIKVRGTLVGSTVTWDQEIEFED